ncbi:hypothetical protein [Leptothoe sp. PORK10 BA2]|jgi:hypothetical protein|uniref:hypothetical protein n=1 Tax=Leptothoe sp. PORK10 BA2 TaxID=3110254 RepID=UPI002B1FCA59|nr:hypothetical protein [Leptothoe sp. PORK10 BA2]MEA5464512.1 hypothetical protein [Leptothoe sp. PORK10 BA2]
MANPNPKIDQLQSFQYQRMNEEPLGKVIGTRYPVSVELALSQLPDGIDKQGFIRAAVMEKLQTERLLE